MSLAVASFALQAASFVGSLYGGLTGAQRQRRIGSRLAADAISRGEESVFAFRQDVSRLLGRQRSAFAAQGVDLQQGSAAQIQSETESFAARDVRQIRLNAAREARALRMGAAAQAQQLQSQTFGAALGSLPTLLTRGRDAWADLQSGRGSLRAPLSPRGRGTGLAISGERG